MTALIPIILKNWKLAATGLLILAIVAGWGVHRVIVAGLESDLAAEVSAHAVCKTNLAGLETALDTQNKAVQRLREDSLAKLTEANSRAQEAREMASRDRKRESTDDRSGPERMNAFMSEAFQ